MIKNHYSNNCKFTSHNVTLYIKEHAWIGHRSMEYYQELLRHPAIEMVSPTIPATDLVRHAVCIFSLNGSVIFEGSIFGIPCGYFSKGLSFQF